jgi:hypothetical protein
MNTKRQVLKNAQAEGDHRFVVSEETLKQQLIHHLMRPSAGLGSQ